MATLTPEIYQELLVYDTQISTPIDLSRYRNFKRDAA